MYVGFCGFQLVSGTVIINPEFLDREQNERLEQMYREARAKYLVAEYETCREKTTSSFLKQVVEQITEERDIVIDLMKAISEAYSALGTEKSVAEEKNSRLTVIHKVDH